MKNKKIIYYMSSTHWDREWYLPFQGFRYELVKTVDDMVNKLENNKDFTCFTFDGQTVVLEDYKQIAGKRTEKLEKLIKEKRVLVGPWYVMPDEFLVSGESLIRNISKGYSVAADWDTEPWKYGYVNDVFGHIAQFPQILSGFGIKGAYLGRGLGNDKKMSHFLWRAPDGSECCGYLGCYCEFQALVADKFSTDEFEGALKSYIDFEFSKSNVPVALIMHTSDHGKADGNVPAIKNKISELYPDCEIRQVSLEEMADVIAGYKEKLPVIEGELSKNCKNPVGELGANIVLVANSISSYYPLKQRNDKCQNMLEKRIEPMLAMAEIAGSGLDHKYVDLAYEYLLKNQPHDSICGCSIDKTHNDMAYRFAQAENISYALTRDFLNDKQKVDSDCEYILSVYNFAAYKERKAVTAKLDFYGPFAKEVDRFCANESADAFEIIGSDGKAMPYQILNTDFNGLKRIDGQIDVKTRSYTVMFEDEFPAMGSVNYRVIPAYPRAVYDNGCISGADFAENKYIKLKITPFGEIELLDKQTQFYYKDLNRFIDDGENGDGWWHMKPKNDTEVLSTSAPCVIEKISDGAVATVFKITKLMSVPECFNEYNHCRSEKRVNLKIETRITVTANSPIVRLETTVDNNAKDHRLRLLNSTGIKSDKYFVGQAFAKIRRNTSVNSESKHYYERETAEKNMNGIIGVNNENGNGLAFVSAEGLHEGDVNPMGDICVTLLRSFHKVRMQPNAVNSEIQGRHTFKYAIVPLNGDVEYCDLLWVQNELAGNCIFRFAKNPNGLAEKENSYIEIDNKHIAVSVIKVAQDGNGIIVRLFCADDKEQSCLMKLGFEIEKAYITDLNENNLKEISVSDNSIETTVTPWKIVTLRLIKR